MKFLILAFLLVSVVDAFTSFSGSRVGPASRLFMNAKEKTCMRLHYISIVLVFDVRYDNFLLDSQIL